MNSTEIVDVEGSESKWKTIFINDTKYSISAVENDSGSWKISLTNLIEIWSETLDPSAILKKCEELNPNLIIEDIDVQDIVRRLLADSPKHAAKASTERIELRTELEGGIFNFAIDLARGGALQLWEEVTMPMCLAAGELSRRHKILLKLVKAKDDEVKRLECKLHDTELNRKHIKIERFCNDLFKNNAPIQNVASCQSAFQEIMQLHGDVKMEKISIKTERTETCFPESLVEAAISTADSGKIERKIGKRYRHTLMSVDGPARKKRRRCVECYRKQRQNGRSATEAASLTKQVKTYCDDCADKPHFSTEPIDTREATVKIEVEENSRLQKIDLVTDGGASKVEGKVTSVDQEFDAIVPKVETPSVSSKLAKQSQSSMKVDKESCVIPKRPQSVRSSPTKRPKKTIHDFIS